MHYRFIDQQGTFVIRNPQGFNLYFPLTNKTGSLLSSISPNLSGDIKTDNEHFLTLPASSEDLRSSLLCRREFFVRVDRRVIRLSRPAQDSLECGFLYQKLTKRSGALRIEITNFIPHDSSAEVMRIRLTNAGKHPVEITPTSFIPLFGRSEKNLRDHRHVSSLLNRIEMDRFGIVLSPTMIFDERGHRLNKTLYYVLGYEDSTRPPVGQFPTLDAFYGRGDICSPDAVVKDTPPLRRNEPGVDGKEACAGLRFSRRRLKPREQAEYVLIMGVAESYAAAKKCFQTLDTPHKVETALLRTKNYWQAYLSGLRFDFQDNDYTNWLLWVKFQPTLRKLFGCSFLPHFDYGKGGRGWRDLWQDALTLLLTEPEKARRLILESFRGVRLDGSNATIITRTGDFIADRNKISRVWMDHGVWPYLTLRLYMDKTGDTGILSQRIAYFRDHQLRRARAVDRAFDQKDFLQRTTAGRVYQGSVLEHLLVQHLVPFFNVGEHNIIRLENADWNDGLDMAANRGESVTFSCMYAHNLEDLCRFLEELKKTAGSVELFQEILMLLEPVDYTSVRAKNRRLDRYFAAVEKISGKTVKVDLDMLIADLRRKAAFLSGIIRKQEWLPQGFFNGYYDDTGRRAEGLRGKTVRMFLPSQVFALMSGAADEQQVTRTWHSIKEHLQDKALTGFRLNTDLKHPYMELGRAFGFAYGEKENGAFFSHMNVMLANALYKRGRIAQGREVLTSIYRMACHSRAGIGPVLPEYFNGQGRGVYAYLTGSASWYIYTLMEEVLGIKFVHGSIDLQPQLVPDDFRAASITCSFALRGKSVTVTYHKSVGARAPLTIRAAYLGKRALAHQPHSCLIPLSCLKSRVTAIRIELA
ncbi:MAG TPA: cellobiose phosphorylase [Candidatus Omnitrophota bacterium]|nr:cellobiose phosphorylase [Candidatus Omnitrophota bacterium]HRZ14594.1 cellobiose phosphorylase [Candidatus Omnitrophota bacterium]